MTLQQIEEALAAGSLWAAMRNGNYWRLRRNGKTQTWKTRAGEFRLPVKCGLKTCTAITHSSHVTLGIGGDFVISDRDPKEVRA